MKFWNRQNKCMRREVGIVFVLGGEKGADIDWEARNFLEDENVLLHQHCPIELRCNPELSTTYNC